MYFILRRRKKILMDVKTTYQIENIIYNIFLNKRRRRILLLCKSILFSQQYKSTLLLIHSAGYSVHRNPNKQLDICVKSNQMDLPYKYLLFLCCNQTVDDVNVEQCPREWFCSYALHMYLYFWCSVAPTTERQRVQKYPCQVEEMNC